MIARHWIRPGGLMLLLALLTACGTVPEQPSEVVTPETEEIRQAELAAASGRPLDAAALYEQAAAAADGIVAARLRVRASLLYLEAGEIIAARRTLAQARATADADPEANRLIRLAEAELLLPKAPEQALELLMPVPAGLEPAWQPRWAGVLAEALLATGRALQAARTFDNRADLLGSAAEREANARRLWQALMAVPMGRLRLLVPGDPDRFGAWLELAYAVRSDRLDADAMRANVAAWRGRYPEHPATAALAAELLDEAVRDLQPPPRIALMLPLSGEYEVVGNAVRRGFLAAYYAQPPQSRPELRIYDIGDGGLDSLSAYRDAVEGGFDMVVGPLTKPALDRLTIWDDYPVPVLALNRLGETPALAATGLYQFGLAPEEDAAASAELAFELGYRRVVSLTPYTDWGDRVHAAFADTFEARGGVVLEHQVYDPEGEDFSDPLRALFNLDASEARWNQLRRTLGISDIAFEPRRREDMEAVFVAAFPREARLIKPQIRFHRGIGLPVIATSHAYSGLRDMTADQDLDGMLIVDLPWILHDPLAAELQTISELMQLRWPDLDPRLARLHALGVDAFRLTGPVNILAAEPGLTLPGATGRLSVGEEGLIRRALQAGVFRDGELLPFDPVDTALGHGTP
jgi:outer membrane PBP1 activator LpoA protein